MKLGIGSTVLASILTVCSCVLSAQSNHAPAACGGFDIPVEMIERAGLKVVLHRLSFGMYRNSELIVRNETGRTITSLIVVVNYLDSEEKPIFAIPYYGGLDTGREDTMGMRPYIKTVLHHPMKPGENIALDGTNLISTTESPVRAEVTFVETEFENGSNRLDFTNYRFTDPILFKTPEIFAMQADVAKLPDELLLTLNLDERGRVRSVEFEQPATLSENLVSQIRSQLMLWSFFPATREGNAVASQLNLVLRFYDKGFPLPASRCSLSFSGRFPRTFVQVDLECVDGREWEVMYGGQYAHGKFETIISESTP